MDRRLSSPELLRTGLNAHRTPQSPLRPPKYTFENVPKAKKDLEGSIVQEVNNRDHFKECMAEMVLLCTEAIKRTSATRSGSKPLSLEYIADRLDVDDPCFGYVARSQEGMMQGFITITTFTNWQKNFKWDSLNECSFIYDNDDEDFKKARKIDSDGSLSKALENTVRLGDPYNEGIVWPRIAEVSLLGGLGCGKQLLKLAIEQLEFQKPTANANYDYLVLQATDNSISFYESLGFVRVGAVTYEDESSKENKAPERPQSPASTSTEASDDAVPAEPLAPSTPEKDNTLARPSNIVSSPLEVHIVQQGGWTPADVAQRHRVDPWDIVFLNKDIYPGLHTRSKLKKGTTLYIPKTVETETEHELPPTNWFVAKENDTPRKIAKMHGIACLKLIQANISRLPGLQATSRLKEGTRVKVNNLDHIDQVCQQYCHWSFPDDASVENGEPSYMMVRKIERKTVRAPREVRASLAVKITEYAPPPLLLDAPKKRLVTVPKQLPPPPTPPPQPPTGIDVFMDHQRQLFPELAGRTPENRRILNGKWENLGKQKKSRYESIAADCANHFASKQEEYKVAYSLWKEECATIPDPPPVVEKDVSLFSKVVKLRDNAIEGKNYTYWFVLTYIPDLKWCHLAPMVPDGVFGPDRKRSEGRTRWRLVDESLGHELDISSMFCIPVRSKALRKTADADKEEWDILDGGNLPPRTPRSSDLQPFDSLVESDTQDSQRSIRKQPVRPRSAVKPLGGSLTVVQKSTLDVVASPSRTTRSNSPSILRSPMSTHAPSFPNRIINPLPRSSPRLMVSPAKRKASEDLDPARKARKINNSGARRSVLQS